MEQQLKSKIEKALNDELDPIKVYEEIEVIYKELDVYKKTLKPKVLDELHRYNGKYNTGNYEFTQFEGGVKYEYETTKHPEWHRLTEEIRKFTELRSQLETFLKSVNKPTEVLIEDEVVTIYPVPRKSTTTFKLTKNKQ